MGVYWVSGPGILCVDSSRLVKTEGFKRQMAALKEIRQMRKRPKNEGNKSTEGLDEVQVI